MKPNDEGYYTHVRILKTTRDKMSKAFPDMSYPAICRSAGGISMTYKCKRILSVLQEHPLKWMTSNEIAKHELCKKWATTTIVAALLSIGEFPGIEYRNANVAELLSIGEFPGIEYRIANLRYRKSIKQYRWNPEGA